MKNIKNKAMATLILARNKVASRRGGDWYTSDAARAVIAIALAVVILGGVTALVNVVIFPALGERLIAIFTA